MEYLSDGISEELMQALSGIAGLRVVARTTAFALKGKREDVRDIGERLHIRQATVRNHLTSILAKLQVRNRFQLVVYGLRRPNPIPQWVGFHEVFHFLTVVAFAAHYTGVSIASYSLR